MAVLFAILKGMGIFLLAVLAICLLLLALAFFVPVRYRVTAVTTDKIRVQYRISWLSGVLSITPGIGEEKVIIRILGIPLEVFRRIGSFFHPHKTGDKRKKEPEKVLVTTDYRDERVKPNPMSESKESQETHTEKTKKKKKTKKKRQKKNFSFEKFSSIITFMKDPANKRGIRWIKKELLDLLCYIKPDQVKAKIVFGTGDPCTTGWLVGVVSMFPAAYIQGLKLCPDFEEKQMKADGYAKGKVRLIYFVRLIIRGYLDPDIKGLINYGFGK